MAMYLFASRISAAVCARTAPPSPTHAAATWPDGGTGPGPGPGPSGRPVCLLQPRKAKSQKKVVLAVTTTEELTMEKEPCIDKPGCINLPPPYHETEVPPPLVHDEGHLVSGTLEALGQLLVPTTDSYPDRGFMFAFLLTSRLFIRPHELLEQVLAACHAQQSTCDKPSTAKERLERLMPPMVRLLEEWTDMFPYDFRDDRMTAAVRGITQGCDCVPQVCDDVSRLLQTLLERLERLERFEDQLANLELESTTNERSQLPATDVAGVCGTASVLAQQLTGLELERMSYIGPEEFILAFMRDVSHPLHQGKDVKKTNNLESYVAWSCHLSQLVATEICKQAAKKQRVKITEFWIEAAKECFNIGNFNSLAAILAGLNMAPVSRLTKTWTKAGSERLTVLRQAMDSAADYDNYRATLKAAVWRAAGSSSSQNIVIPLFALFVKDLYGLADPCSNKLPGDHINMEAVWLLAKSLTDFISWQQTVCPFTRCAKAVAYLQASPVLSDKALMLASFDCESPETSLEKERYITLKLV
ncbi:ras-GEF domain-containing family member 1B-like [Homalodisca vitripennis]|uniref:ras-GEF domain-containing family member 1B-like n=1 Tax=Homalodisca vitripennis TaxID=197043 RepID=UPI001EEA1DC4|nr:ras-GEF domain-containing family member 1B-like [Homalodisca vitripennis]